MRPEHVFIGVHMLPTCHFPSEMRADSVEPRLFLRLDPTICFSCTWSTSMDSAEGPWKGNPDVTRAREQGPTVLLSAPIISTLLKWHSADVRGKDSDQRCVYIKVLPCHSDNKPPLCHAYQAGTPYQPTQKHCWMRLLQGFFFRFNSLDVFAQSVFQDPQWHNSGISVTSHLFMLNVEYCQSVTGVGQALFWALPVDGKREKACVGKPKWYQTWYGIPCGRQADNGEWEAALVLINTEHKALRCSLRHFARPLSGTCSVLPSLSRAENSALQLEHGGCFFPDETLLVDRYYNTDGNRPSKKNEKKKKQKTARKGVIMLKMQLWWSNKQASKEELGKKTFFQFRIFLGLSVHLTLLYFLFHLSASSEKEILACIATSSRTSGKLAAGGRDT